MLSEVGLERRRGDEEREGWACGRSELRPRPTSNLLLLLLLKNQSRKRTYLAATDVEILVPFRELERDGLKKESEGEEEGETTMLLIRGDERRDVSLAVGSEKEEEEVDLCLES